MQEAGDSRRHRWGVILAGGDGRRLLSLTRKLAGELTKDYLPEIDCLLNEKGSACQTVSLDLGDVTFVDREAMVFLCAAKTRNIRTCYQ
jgi:ABC-type transporter Mla MlaB component